MAYITTGGGTRQVHVNRLQRIAKARLMGCKMPRLAWNASVKTGVPFWVICAFLEKETSGGRNIFGNDASIFSGAGIVTESKYHAYKALRKRTGQMQGVGPMQLTWYSYQDRADAQGGCWRPQVNIITGAQILQDLKTPHNTWWDVSYKYNGSAAYANQMSVLFGKWFRALN